MADDLASLPASTIVLLAGRADLVRAYPFLASREEIRGGCCGQPKQQPAYHAIRLALAALDEPAAARFRALAGLTGP